MGISEYGTCLPSELRDFSRKQRGSGMTGTGTMLSFASHIKEYELWHVNHGGSENHSYSPAIPRLFHGLEHSRNSRDEGGRYGI